VEAYLVFVSSIYVCIAVGDPVTKRRRWLGSSYQEEEMVGIQLPRGGDGWDPVTKRRRWLGSSYQEEEMAGIQLPRGGDGWDPVTKRRRWLGSH
jgi:hypothetical protein